MAKCTVEPKLDFDKFKEACERFKKICEREMGEAFPNIDTEYPVVLKNTRDCEACVHARPFGGENDNRCSVWECDYINRDEAIEAYRTREWIPTSLCLPKECRPVLVAVKTKDRLPKWIEKQTYHYVTDIDVYDENGWMDNGKNVVAWQPLPAPYKGE